MFIQATLGYSHPAYEMKSPEDTENPSSSNILYVGEINSMII
jgi:hypothetical protein